MSSSERNRRLAARRRVAVVGLEDGPERCAGPGVLAALSRERFHRVAIAGSPHESGARCEELFDALAGALTPASGSREAAEQLAELAREHEIEAFLPGSPAAARILARASRLLARAGARTPPFDRAALERLRADGIAVRCERGRVPVAELYPLAGDVTAAELAASGPWPVTLLGSDGARRRAVDALEAARAARTLRSQGAVRVGLAHVDARNTYEQAALVGSDGRWLGSASVRVLADDDRLRPWLAVTVDDERLERAGREALAVLDLRGPCSLLLHERGGEIELADLQPGFPVWIEVVLGGGPNLVELAVDDLLGGAGGSRVEPAGRTPAGTLFSHCAHDVVVGADAAPTESLR
jgi:hypothetical protein